MAQAATSAEMNGGTNVTMQTPPLSRSLTSTSSAALRRWPLTACADEWLKITGAVATSSAACMVVAATCDRSTSTPMRCISATIARPSSSSPPTPGSSVAESAHDVLWLCVSVTYRTPRRAKARSTPSDVARLWPPSMPISDAIRPPPIAASTSSAEYAIARSRGYAAASRYTASICSMVATTASGSERSEGTYTDQNWPPTPPARSRAMSVWNSGRSAASPDTR
nr:hypothetical protein GCM10020092_055320 [Actinoplanes digitatis]